MIPTTESGRPFKILDYKGQKHEKLTDEDVHRLSKALKNNTKFFGRLILAKN
jgi:hypothetical protein